MECVFLNNISHPVEFNTNSFSMDILTNLLPRLTEMSVNARDLTDILGKSEISIDKLTENLDSIEMLGDSVLRLEASSKEMLNKVNAYLVPC